MTPEEREAAALELCEEMEGMFGGGLEGAMNRHEVARLMVRELRGRFLLQVLRSRVGGTELGRMLGVSHQRGLAVVRAAREWGEAEALRRRREEYRLAKERERVAARRRSPKPLAELEGSG
jgi:hypothetical protein